MVKNFLGITGDARCDGEYGLFCACLASVKDGFTTGRLFAAAPLARHTWEPLRSALALPLVGP